MDPKQLEYFKNRLLQKQLSLGETVHRNEDYGREKDQDTQDIGDMALESYTKEFIFGKSAGDREILQLIQEALNRIEDASFGLCCHCENPISEKRLEAVPWACYCVACQDLKEKGLLDRTP
jgi:DnaK suppressor protein